jgi:hypothetical protein
METGAVSHSMEDAKQDMRERFRPAPDGKNVENVSKTRQIDEVAFCPRLARELIRTPASTNGDHFNYLSVTVPLTSSGHSDGNGKDDCNGFATSASSRDRNQTLRQST